MKTYHYSRTQLINHILHDARAVDIPSGAAESIAAQVSSQVEQWLSTKTTITKKDFDRVVSAELAKYNPDLSYIYHNRDKII